ncbi:MAG: 1-deoxy-D-xylulose-5-phosphate reductoisomerase, partial [Planctomycetes bacterium]|nr:1-deoxy-D-xylulose-5-phosphate reductoisomerase [Planctomycetota bacterium]
MSKPATKAATNVAVLGSTGSIGRSGLSVIANSQGRLKAVGLSAHSSLDLLARQTQEFQPHWIVTTDPEAAAGRDWSDLPQCCTRTDGPDAMAELVSRSEVDVVLAAIVGSAGLSSTWAAIAAGKRVALANKETLVMAGPLVMELARTSGATIIPVDSEHSAVFQALQAGRRDQVRRIVLTASGGPLRHRPLHELGDVTVEEALAHPTWSMGRKITIDSATMMNKALEIIEARWLFDLQPEQIAVVIHPQSIVHSMVEFVDGSVVAQLSPPDMKLPIQVALEWPERHAGVARRMDFGEPQTLEFEPPDMQRFDALQLGMEAAR